MPWDSPEINYMMPVTVQRLCDLIREMHKKIGLMMQPKGLK
jgi:hypothetical protein